MSVRAHRCPGEDCGICEAAITSAELERDFPDDRVTGVDPWGLAGSA